MNIISHRGLWRSPEEHNSRAALKRTVAEGFGTETDLRDSAGKLVVSHDPPVGEAMACCDLLQIFDETKLPLAVNIKADGLAPLLRQAFEAYTIDWFAFDMSAPEMVRYLIAGLPFYTRHSDVEPEPILYQDALGVWLDAFRNDWFDQDIIMRHLDRKKRVCVVSPELHGRSPQRVWEMLSLVDGDVTLCTDLPERARGLFND